METVYLLNNGHHENLLPPARDGDACHDMIAQTREIVGDSVDYGDRKAWRSVDYIEYDTGIKMAPECGAVFSLIAPRSSVSKCNLLLANSVGVVDNGYRGTIRFRFKYIWQPEDFMVQTDPIACSMGIQFLPQNGFVFGALNENKIYKAGDKIGQLRFVKNLPVKFVLTEGLPSSDRGEGGFGSTGA